MRAERARVLRVIGRLERMPASDAAPLDFLWAGTGQHEGYTEHQLLFLAAVAHAAEALGARAFVGEPYEVVPELIVFVGPGEKYRPVSHPVPFVA